MVKIFKHRPLRIFVLTSTFYCLLASLFLISCSRKDASYVIGEIPKHGLLLDRWRVVGPFVNPGKETEFIEVDNLVLLGKDEAGITYEEFSGIQKSDSIKSEWLQTEGHKLNFNNFFLSVDSSIIDGNVYAACRLISDRNRIVKLNFSADDGCKIWLNNRLIFQRDRIGPLKYYDNYIDLELNSGENFLLVKVNNVQYGWEMFAVLEEPSAEGLNHFKRIFSLEFENYYLDRSVVRDTLKINPDFYGVNFGIDFLDEAEDTIFSDSILQHNKMWNISSLPDGLYTTRLSSSEHIFQEDFYKGDIIQAIAKMIDGMKLTSATDHGNVKALVHRFNHILKPGNTGSDIFGKRDWDKKLIFLFKNLKYYGQYGVMEESHRPPLIGGGLRSYRSPIDSGVQYYQVFVPRGYNKEEKLPLVIEMPKLMNWHPSPLETNRFANIRLFELFEDMATKYNMIILDPGCRTVNTMNVNSIDEADLWEAVHDLQKYYSIDTSRVYLRGACLSSRSAMRMATKYPGYFAALSITAPQMTLKNSDNIWLQQNEPLNYLENIKTLPILNIHSILDDHSPIAESYKLNEKIYTIEFDNYTYKELQLEFKTFYSEEYMEDMFSFFSRHRIVPSPSEIKFKTAQLKYNKSFWLTLDRIATPGIASVHAVVRNNIVTVSSENVISFTIDLHTLPHDRNEEIIVYHNSELMYKSKPAKQSVRIGSDGGVGGKTKDIEGPFAHIFSKPFMIVVGSNGSEMENSKMQACADSINNDWQKRYFTSCPIKTDKDVTEWDLHNKSILLIGTPQSNAILEKASAMLPLEVNSNYVRIGDHRLNGTVLNFYFIYPNPVNPRNYLAVIGYNNSERIGLGSEDEKGGFKNISDYGWFDFKIWNSDNTSFESGYFDNQWN